MDNDVRQQITKTPGVCGGKACIAGHRVRVMDVVACYAMRGMAPEEIVGAFPGITLSDVHSALAYYYDHREEIDADFRHDREVAESLRHRFPSILAEKLCG